MLADILIYLHKMRDKYAQANQSNFVLVVVVAVLSLCLGFAPADWVLYTTYFSILSLVAEV